MKFKTIAITGLLLATTTSAFAGDVESTFNNRADKAYATFSNCWNGENQNLCIVKCVDKITTAYRYSLDKERPKTTMQKVFQFNDYVAVKVRFSPSMNAFQCVAYEP